MSERGDHSQPPEEEYPPEVKAATDSSGSKRDLHFNWTIIASGRLYRIVMRASHRLGFCWPEPQIIEPGMVWCIGAA